MTGAAILSRRNGSDALGKRVVYEYTARVDVAGGEILLRLSAATLNEVGEEVSVTVYNPIPMTRAAAELLIQSLRHAMNAKESAP